MCATIPNFVALCQTVVRRTHRGSQQFCGRQGPAPWFEGVPDPNRNTLMPHIKNFNYCLQKHQQRCSDITEVSSWRSQNCWDRLPTPRLPSSRPKGSRVPKICGTPTKFRRYRSFRRTSLVPINFVGRRGPRPFGTGRS